MRGDCLFCWYWWNSWSSLFKLSFPNYTFSFLGYDCGVYVISTAEHLCRELCEGYSINLNDLVTPESINEKRKLIKDLVYQVADEFGSWHLIFAGEKTKSNQTMKQWHVCRNDVEDLSVENKTNLMSVFQRWRMWLLQHL